jgi:hypothetical protein
MERKILALFPGIEQHILWKNRTNLSYIDGMGGRGAGEVKGNQYELIRSADPSNGSGRSAHSPVHLEVGVSNQSRTNTPLKKLPAVFVAR